MRLREMVKETAHLLHAHAKDKFFKARTAVIKLINPHAIVVRGDWYLNLYGPDGKIKARRWVPVNLVVTAGKNHLASFLSTASGSGDYTMKYIGLGTNNTAAAAGDTTLNTELAGGGYSRATGTKSNPSGAIYRVVGTFAAGNGTGTLVEAGTFSASSAGTMLNRQVFSSIAKGADDSLEVTMEITFS